jgi:tetratricopeptide (TPR) repeat protein
MYALKPISAVPSLLVVQDPRFGRGKPNLLQSAHSTMATFSDIEQAISKRDTTSIYQLMMHGCPPAPRPGYRIENQLWDYKGDCPKPGKAHLGAWAEIAIDVLAFHNARGGILIFGIRDADFGYCGASTRLDSKLFNDQIRRFLGDRIWVEFHRPFIQEANYLGVAVVPPRGLSLERFKADSPPTFDGKQRFKGGDSAIRDEDSSRILRKVDADAFARTLDVPSLGKTYIVDEPQYRILHPDYANFVLRRDLCEAVERGLSDLRTSVTSLIGIGGGGKTALATWAALRAFERKQFSFICSITAKDRELTSSGIQALSPQLTSFESLLDSILETLDFPQEKLLPVPEREAVVRALIEGSNGLLYVDNLETVDDVRIVQFLDTLPVGVKALTTSRRSAVRVSVFPITLSAFNSKEVIDYIGSLAQSIRQFTYATELSDAERTRLGSACDGLPLAIRWVLSRCFTAAEALAMGEALTLSRKHGEELLEFCFRRVFEAMPQIEQGVLQVLCLFQQAVPAEALFVGAGVPDFKLMDATEDLIADGLIQRLFDSDRNDYSYLLLPVTRAFVLSQVTRTPGLEDRIRGRLRTWYEALDVKDPNDRIVIRALRQGKSGSENALVDLGNAALKRGDNTTAKQLFEQALQRNPTSWRAAKSLAEHFRHTENNRTEALRLYELAAGNAPRRGEEKALIFREWGMLLRDSGDFDATDSAIEKFEVALFETPNDVVAIHALAVMLLRKGSYKRILELLEPLIHHPNSRTRELVLPVLLSVYTATHEMLKAAELKSQGVQPWKL